MACVKAFGTAGIVANLQREQSLGETSLLRMARQGGRRATPPLVPYVFRIGTVATSLDSQVHPCPTLTC